MKKYKYDSKRYLLSVTIPGFFMILILIYALFNNYTNFNLNIYSLLIIVCTYGIFNTFISSSNPKKIIIDSKCIRIREFYNKKIYVKINDGNLFKGRYWIRTNMFNNSIALYSYFIELEECLYPDSLKFRNKKFENKNI